MKNIAVLVTLVATAIPTGAQAVNDDARDLFNRAQKAPLSQRVELLERSVAIQPTFEAQYALGQTYYELKKFTEAMGALRKSFEMAGVSAVRARAAAAYYMGLVAEESGELLRAEQLLQASLEYSRDPDTERALARVQVKESNSVVPAIEIQRSLFSRDLFLVPARATQASISLRVGFDTDRAELSALGQRQAGELGQALSADAFRSLRIVLIGHTDVRGPDSLNDRLSLDRAMSVREFLVRNFGLKADNIAVEGHGARELIDRQDSMEAHARNRRVEVLTDFEASSSPRSGRE